MIQGQTIALLVLSVLTVALFLSLVWYRQTHANRLGQLQNEHAFALSRQQERLASAERTAQDQANTLQEQAGQMQALRMQLSTEQQERARQQERAARLPAQEEAQAVLSQRVGLLQQEAAELRAQLAGSQAQLEAQNQRAAAIAAQEHRHFEEKLALLRDAKTALTDNFKTLANDILVEKTQTFTQHNKTNMEAVLSPLQAQLDAFRKKVDEVYVSESKDRSGLASQVKQLMELNGRLSAEADNLTRALKGSSKVQGDWGEVVLERILEESGMRPERDYILQESHLRSDGSRVRPDVIIRLPDDKCLVIDAKVSLVDYLTAANAATPEERSAALKRHATSVREHVKGLSKRNYQSLHGDKAIDFVLMFIPIEPAFMAAISDDAALWSRAWERDVLLVSPSTLLFVLRTVAHLWRQEQQQQNSLLIAQRGAELHTKLVGFVEDLTALGDRLRQAQETHDKAFKKLSTGRGNLVRQAQKLEALGVKTSKKLRLLEAQEAEDTTARDEAATAIEEAEGGTAIEVRGASDMSDASDAADAAETAETTDAIEISEKAETADHRPAAAI